MIPRTKSCEMLADELRRMIETGRIRPGEKLRSIDRLAMEYRVGRSTVREALSRLKALGLIESRQGGGTYVRRPGIESHAMPETLRLAGADLARVLEVRRMLEVGAAELAARHRTDDDVERLGRIIAQMRESGGSDDSDGSIGSVGGEAVSPACEADFHLAIARASGNAVLADMVEHLLRAMEDGCELRCCGGGSRETAGELFRDHVELFEAIRDGDAKRASAAMARHMILEKFTWARPGAAG